MKARIGIISNSIKHFFGFTKDFRAESANLNGSFVVNCVFFFVE